MYKWFSILLSVFLVGFVYNSLYNNFYINLIEDFRVFLLIKIDAIIVEKTINIVNIMISVLLIFNTLTFLSWVSSLFDDVGTEQREVLHEKEIIVLKDNSDSSSLSIGKRKIHV